MTPTLYLLTITPDSPPTIDPLKIAGTLQYGGQEYLLISSNPPPAQTQQISKLAPVPFRYGRPRKDTPQPKRKLPPEEIRTIENALLDAGSNGLSAEEIRNLFQFPIHLGVHLSKLSRSGTIRRLGNGNWAIV